MDEIIRKIINIDKRARDIRKKADEDVEHERHKTEADIENLRKQMMENAGDEAKKLYDETVNNARNEGEAIRDSGDAESKRMDEVFIKVKDEAEERLLNQIIESVGERNHV